jgi:hypothetical protein
LKAKKELIEGQKPKFCILAAVVFLPSSNDEERG